MLGTGAIADTVRAQRPDWVGAAWEALRTMESHRVRRLPVIGGYDLVGMLSQADVVQATSGRPAVR
jgi:CBS domain-containing protein